MENLVFTQLSIPEMRQLFRQELETYFSVKDPNPQPQETDRWLDITELCAFLPDKPVKATVYGWVHFRVIPCHRRGKKLYFLKSEIDTWLKAGRKKTYAETAKVAEQYLLTKKGLHNGK